MPIVVLTDTIESEVGANEPWPEDVKLFQPFEIEQILLPDNANCLAVQAFLRMCNLKYEIVHKKNAEDMSPSGRVPFVKCREFLISDLEPLTSFAGNKIMSSKQTSASTSGSDSGTSVVDRFNALAKAATKPRISAKDLEVMKPYRIDSLKEVESQRYGRAVIAIIEVPEKGGELYDCFLPKRFGSVFDSALISSFNEKPGYSLRFLGIGDRGQHMIELIDTSSSWE